MSEQDRIELAFSRRRFAALIGIAVITGCGLLAAGLFAGIEVGSVQARASMPAPLPLQFVHELPVLAADLTQRGYSAGVLDFKDQARAKASQAAMELGRFARTEPIVRAVGN